MITITYYSLPDQILFPFSFYSKLPITFSTSLRISQDSTNSFIRV